MTAVQQTIASLTPFSQAITSTGEFYSLLPQMALGEEEGQMRGARIMPTSLVVDFGICLDNNATNSQDLTAHLFCLTQNNIKSYNQVGSMTHLFLRDPTVTSPGLTTYFDGSFQNGMLPVDTRAFKVLAHKKIHFKKGFGVSVEGATSGSVLGVYCPGQTVKHVRVKVKVPKVLKYQEDTSSTIEPYPSNFNPIWCLGWVYNDDYGVGSARSVLVSSVVTMKYKNA